MGKNQRYLDYERGSIGGIHHVPSSIKCFPISTYSTYHCLFDVPLMSLLIRLCPS